MAEREGETDRRRSMLCILAVVAIRERDELVIVGVWLRLESIDMAEPGRGVGLGLGGPSESMLANVSSDSGIDSDAPTDNADALSTPEPEPEASAEKTSDSTLSGCPPSPATITEASNRSDFSDPSLRPTDPRIRGLRPLSSTRLRALRPTQFTSCCSASRSDTARLGAVLRTVLGRGSVP